MSADLQQQPGMPHSGTSSIRIERVLELVLLGGLAFQMALTWPLWFPLESVLPAVTMWGTPRLAMAWESLLSCSLLIFFSWGLFSKVRHSQWLQISQWAMFLSLMLLVMLNVQRFQPWLWHFVLMRMALSIGQSDQTQLEKPGLVWAQRLTIAIYFFSAISKFDHYFLTHQANQLLAGLFHATGFNDAFLSDEVRLLLKDFFPVGELLVALLLMSARTRIYGLMGATALHAGLLLTLGPLGLRHNPPVLVWNILFLSSTWLCFWQFRTSKGPGVSWFRADKSSMFQSTIVKLAIVFPLLEWIGFADAWPAWCLYAARQGTASIEVRTSTPPAQFLTDALQPVDLEGWQQLDVHRLSFQQTGAPPYPAGRFLNAWGEWISHQPGVEQVRVRIGGPPNRWNGRQTHTEFLHSAAHQKSTVP